MVVHSYGMGAQDVLCPGPPPVFRPEIDEVVYGVLLRGSDPSAPGDSTEPLPVQLEVPAGETGELVVTEVYRTHNDRAVIKLDLAELQFCIDHGDVTDEEKIFLNELAMVAEERADSTSELKRLEERFHQIEQDQNRIRCNLQDLDQQSTLYKPYLAQLNSQEDELAELTENRKRVLGVLAQREEAARQLVRDLVREA